MMRVFAFILLLTGLALFSKLLLALLLLIGWSLTLRLDLLVPSWPSLSWFIHGVILGTLGWWIWREVPKVGTRLIWVVALLVWLLAIEVLHWLEQSTSMPVNSPQSKVQNITASTVKNKKRSRVCPMPAEQDRGKGLVAGPLNGLNFVNIPGGCFNMGSPSQEYGRNEDEGPQGKVCVSPFHLSVREVTTAQFETFQQSISERPDPFPLYANVTEIPRAGANGKPFLHDQRVSLEKGCKMVNQRQGDQVFIKDIKTDWRAPGFPQTKDSPVVCIHQLEAQQFIEWLNELEGKQVYRLPTEAEWEYAARAGSNQPYYWGEDDRKACEHENSGDQDFDDHYFSGQISHFPCQDDHVWTAPVGCYAPNPFGLYDMLGNVSEWVADRYAPYPDSTATRHNPKGPHQSRFLLFRGGSWMSWPEITRAANRNVRSDSSIQDARLGFRVAMSMPSEIIGESFLSHDATE